MENFICGLLVAIIVSVYTFFGLLSGYVSDKEFKESTGTTNSELSRMKEECEHSLPRNQHCMASIIFIPTVSEE